MQKIAVISFDYYSYDQYIVKALQKRHDVDAIHIDFSKIKYTYHSKWEKIHNFYLKNIQNRNLKKEFIESEILKQLGEKTYDQILVMRPDRLSIPTLKNIKKKCHSLVCYIYDSSQRFDFKYLLESNLFDRMFTFDKNDSEIMGIPWISNFIFWEKEPLNPDPEYDIFLISSIDERLNTLNQVSEYCRKTGISTHFTLVGKPKGKTVDPSIQLTRSTQSLDQLKPQIQNSFAVLDLVRERQNGLSFRPFEAMPLGKKLITNNVLIKEYAFYNPENIFVFEKKIDALPKEFFEVPYQQIEDSIYQEFTVDHWVKVVFELP